MEDKRTPMEPAELLEVPGKEKPGKHCPPDGYFGTAVPEATKKNYSGLWIVLCLAVVFLCSAIVIFSFLRLRIETRDGRLLFTIASPDNRSAPLSTEPVNLTPDASPSVPDAQQAADGFDANIPISPGDGRESYTVSELYAMVNPSVVCILSQGYSTEATGTGVIMTADGYILTAQELLRNTTAITVIFSDGSSASAGIVGADSSTGVAVIKVDTAAALTPAQFASPDGLQVGDRVISIGNPYGSQLRNVLSEGVVSVISSEVSLDGLSLTLMKTSADIACKGCPVINGAGQVVAVTTGIGTRLTDDGSDPNLAVSIVSVKQLAEQLLQNGYVASSCWLGFELEEIPEPYQTYYGYPGSLWIDALGSETAAAQMLRLWDVILAVDGKPVRTIDEFYKALSAYRIGDTVELTIYRAGTLYLATLPLTNR